MLTYPDIPEINKLISPRTNQYLESVGLLFYAEHETMRDMLIKDALSGDKLIYGYFGYPYVCRDFGDMRVNARTFPDGVRYDDAARYEITYKSSCTSDQNPIYLPRQYLSWSDSHHRIRCLLVVYLWRGPHFSLQGLFLIEPARRAGS